MKTILAAVIVSAFSLGAVAQTTAPATPATTAPMTKSDSMMKKDGMKSDSMMKSDSASAPMHAKKAKKHMKAASTAM